MCVAAMLWATTASAQLVFSFTYTDVVNSTGTGYADPTFGAVRRDALQSATNSLGQGLHNNSSVAPDVWYYSDRFLTNRSGRHTDDLTFTGMNQLLMNAATVAGPGVRTLSPRELGILADLGYSVIPEPSTCGLICGADSLAGAVYRRRTA